MRIIVGRGEKSLLNGPGDAICVKGGRRRAEKCDEVVEAVGRRLGWGGVGCGGSNIFRSHKKSIAVCCMRDARSSRRLLGWREEGGDGGG